MRGGGNVFPADSPKKTYMRNERWLCGEDGARDAELSAFSYIFKCILI